MSSFANANVVMNEVEATAPRAAEDESFVQELHKRAKHAQEQMELHGAELAKWRRVSEMCEAALQAGQPQQVDSDAWVYTEERVQQRKAR
jgi:cytochrome c5